MTLDDLVARADELIQLCEQALARKKPSPYAGYSLLSEDFANLRSASLSFIELVYGREHTHYGEFQSHVKDTPDYYAERGLGILRAIRAELGGGWLRTTRGLVSAEVFSDFLEMAEHLLEEGYKDPAAILCGGVLEGHLRQLALGRGLPIDDRKGGKAVPRRADALNADLAAKAVYSKLDQKSVTAWLDLRNKAAHGRYDEYTKDQVVLLLAGVRDFVARNPP